MKEGYKNKIEEVMTSAMNGVKSLIDVDVIVGDPIVSSAEIKVIPLTKVTMGFVAGGGEYSTELQRIKKEEFPFAGGSGAGVSMQPIGFLVIKNKSVEIVKVDAKTALEKLIEVVPEVASFVSKNFKKSQNNTENS